MEKRKWLVVAVGGLLAFIGSGVAGLAFHLPGWATSIPLVVSIVIAIWGACKFQNALDRED